MSEKSVNQLMNELQERIEQKEIEIKTDMQSYNTLCELSGKAAYYDLQDSLVQKGASSFKPDEFYGQALATSITTILEANTTAMSSDNIFDRLIEGGYQFESSEDKFAKRSMVISMSKNAKFHKLPNGMWGLLKWYPNAKIKKIDTSPEPSTERDSSEYDETRDTVVNERFDQVSKFDS